MEINSLFFRVVNHTLFTKFCFESTTTGCQLSSTDSADRFSNVIPTENGPSSLDNYINIEHN